MVTKEEIRGHWNSMAGSVKEKYGQITDDDLARVEGDTEQLIGLIQRKTGQSREQAEAYVHELHEETQSTLGSLSSAVSTYAESAGGSLRDGYREVSTRAREGYAHSAEGISSHPVESVLAALSVGLITGIAIGISISHARRPEPTWRDRWMS